MNPWEVPTSVLGAGGVLIHRDQVLLVRVNYGKAKGQWILPGGRVEGGERLEEAVLRELHEETGIPLETVAVDGMIAARHRVLPGQRADVYFLFRLKFSDPSAPIPANLRWPEQEIIEARFWPVHQALAAVEDVRPVTRAAIQLAAHPEARLYRKAPHREGFIPEDTLYCPLE